MLIKMQSGYPTPLNFSLIIPTLCERPSQLRLLFETLGKSKYSCKIILVTKEINHEALIGLLDYFCPNFPYILVSENDESGLALAINQGIENIETKYWNWIGDDDILELPAVAHLIESLELNSKCSFAYGSTIYFDDDHAFEIENRSSQFAQQMIYLGPNLIPQPSCVFRAEVDGVEIGLDSSYKFAFDQDFIQRLLASSKALFVPMIVSRYRWSSDTLTSINREASIRESLQIRQRHARNSFEKVVINILAPVTRFVLLMSVVFFKVKAKRIAR
jgi:hypothetical protein